MSHLVNLIFKNELFRTFRRARRVNITTSCRDADYIPKVKGAGKEYLDGKDQYYLMHNGVRILKGTFHDELISPILKRLKGHHEPQEEKAFYEVLKSLKSGSTMIELGSYWAYYSLWFNKEIKHANNYMIEPIPKNLEYGKRNFAFNKVKGDFTNAVIGKKHKKSANFIESINTQHNIPQVSIDSFIKSKNIKYVDIIHSDIQGAEHDMLLGASESIKNNKIGYFFISTHSNKIHNLCIAYLKKSRFKIICEHSIEESYSGDGLIVAKAGKVDGPSKIDISKRKVLIPFFAKV